MSVLLYCTLYPFNLPLMVSLVSCTGCQWIVRADTLNGSAYIFYTFITLGNECVILYLISFQSSSDGLSSILYRLPVNCQCRLIEWFCVHILYLNSPRVVTSVLYSTLYPFSLPLMASLVSCTGCQGIIRADTLNGSAYIFYTLITLGNECVILYLISFQSSSHGISSILYRLPVNCQCRLIEWFCVHILYLNYPRVVMSVLYCTLYPFNLPLMATLVSCTGCH